MTLADDLLALVPFVAPRAFSNLHALENTAELSARACADGIPGDFVECGVFAGAHCALMAKAIMLSGQTTRRVHLFDSFEGIPEAGPRDAEWPGIGPLPGVPKTGRLRSTGISACSMEHVQAHMDGWGINQQLLVYHRGWFQHTLPKLYEDLVLDSTGEAGRWSTANLATNPREIALLRLDGDLYESTKVCLEHLYHRLSDGGFCIVDDHALAGCAAAVQDFFSGQIPEYHRLEGGEIWWQK